MRSLVLLARDHLEKTRLEVAAPLPFVACALTAGEAASRNPKTQANEDSLAVLETAGGAAVVVADAHFGARAGETLIQDLAARLSREAPADRESLSRLLFELDKIYVEEKKGEDISETTLLVAIVRGKRAIWASIADSHVYRARRDSLERQNADSTLFAGGREPLATLVVPGFCEPVETGELELAPGDLLVLASDGIGEEDSGLAPEAVARALTASGPLPSRVRTVADAARREASGGGRDNLALVVVEPPASP